MTTELWKLDAVAQAELVARGEVSALELVDAAIARIEAVEPMIHALDSTDFESARARALANPKGALGGVPILIKDLLPYPGLPCRFGSRLFRHNLSAQGSEYSARLDAAGMIPLGKTTTSEFGLLGSTESLLSGLTRNPWSLALSATGSSGGAAAAVASGMVPIAHASDGGGSIRIPASACGLFGLKPSRGRCASTGQQWVYDLLSEHCVTRSVRDSALFLSLTEVDNAALGPRVGYIQQPLARPLRIAFYRQTLMGQEPSAEVMQALRHTVQLCEALGHELQEVAAPPVSGQAVSDGFFTIAGFGMTQLVAMMSPLLGRAPGPSELEPFTLELIDWFSSLPEGAVARAISALDAAGMQLRTFVDGYDAVLCPTMPVPPPSLGSLAPTLGRKLLLSRTEQLAGYTPIHNIAGLPAMSVPLYWTEQGIPIGSHFTAPLGDEALLLGLAYQLERAASWSQRLPEAVSRSQLQLDK